MGIILLLVSILPPIVLMGIIYACDRVEKEPIWFVALIYFLGMISTIPILIVELVGDGMLSLFTPLIGDGFIYKTIEYFFIVAATEEFFKFAVVRLIVWYNKAFNYRFDAIVYCVASSLGFALVENVMYVLGNGLGTGIMRAILSVPGHCSFAVFMGFLLGHAKYAAKRKKMGLSVCLQLLAFMIPVGIHGLYDLCLSLESILAILVFFMVIGTIDVLAIIQIIIGEKTDVPFDEIIPVRPIGQVVQQDLQQQVAVTDETGINKGFEQ